MPFRSRLYILTQLWLELTREMSRIHAPQSHGQIGADAQDLLLAAAIYLDTIEDRHMNASQLADRVGLPRPTMLRRIEALEAAGLVERRGATWRSQFKALTRAEDHDLTAITNLLRQALDELIY